MAPKRYSIYASDTLDKVLAERTAPEDGEAEGRSRSQTITYMCDRYAEMCRRSMPVLPLNSWLLIMDAMNGTYTWQQPFMAASGLAHNVWDGCELNDLHNKWQVPDWQGLAKTLADLPFASQIAVIDAVERFWEMGMQQGEDQPSDSDPFAHWRAPLRRLVGRLADDQPVRNQT